MMSAQQDSSVDVGCAPVTLPVVDVVGFTPARWALAPWPSTTAISSRERNALAGREESLRSADIERLTGRADQNRRLSCAADDPVHGGEAYDHPVGLPDARLKRPGAVAAEEITRRDEHSNTRRPRAKHHGRVGVGSGDEQVEESVGGVLLGGSVIVRDARGLVELVRVGKLHDATFRGGRAIDELTYMSSRLRVEQPGCPRHAIGERCESKRSRLTLLALARDNRLDVESLAQILRESVQSVDVELPGGNDELFTGLRQGVARDALVRLAEPCPDRVKP